MRCGGGARQWGVLAASVSDGKFRRGDNKSEGSCAPREPRELVGAVQRDPETDAVAAGAGGASRRLSRRNPGVRSAGFQRETLLPT